MQDEERKSLWVNLAIFVGLVLLCVIFWNTLKTPALLVILLGILVTVHELGHFLAARWVGVRVIEFAFGFGPRLMTVMRRGGTDYTIRAIPIGGFVNMAGMQPDEADLEDGLAGKPPAARAFVFIAGPLMNLLLALLLFCSMGSLIGVMDEKQVLVQGVNRRSPAAAMGLKVGDHIISVRGTPIRSISHLIDVVHGGPGTAADVVVRRQNQVLTLRGAPIVQTDPRGRPIIDRRTHQPAYGFGFMPGPAAIGARVDPISSIRQGVSLFRNYFILLYQVIRDRDLANNLGGPVRISTMTSDVAQMPAGRVFLGYYMNLMASLSISLGVLNLLPIPVLDGGHLFLLSIEVLRRKRLTPDAVRVAQYVGLAVIGIIFALIMYNDLTSL